MGSKTAIWERRCAIAEEKQAPPIPSPLLPSPTTLTHTSHSSLNQCYLSFLLIFHDKEKTAEINGVKRRG